uniref:Integrase catalytic domain-containing protein n=1 Tax=Fundulus heteroclitus TaxID=8078 RepID=A0A3Q2U3D0_FUNHE
IAQLRPTRSMDVIVHLKSMFARHGIPETIISDNGPQFRGQEMKAFATDYCFEHITSSPKYPKSNSEAERAFQTVKNLFKKASDPYRALLAYRATPLSNGYSPAELLMGRRLRTTLPILPERLQPVLPDLQVLRQTERKKRWADAKCFNSRNRARDLGKLSPGDNVWIADAAEQGKVSSVHSSPRSYLVMGPQGTLRRNRCHLIPMPESGSECEQQQEQPPEADSGVENPPPATESVNAPDIMRLRSGREIKKPDRLNLWGKK